jgi:hypothetical protein
MSIQHPPKRSIEEINSYIKETSWRENIYIEMSNELGRRILRINSSKTKEEILLTLVSLNVYCNEALKLYPIWEKYKKNWTAIGFTKKDFTINDIKIELFGGGSYGLFKHDLSKPTYEFMNSISLMVKRYGSTVHMDNNYNTLRAYAWGVGFNYCIEIYSSVIYKVNIELFELFGGKGRPILPHV